MLIKLSALKELTPWDLQLLLVDHIHKGLLFHKPKGLFEEEPNSNSLIEQLKATLSQALNIFYPLAGRLALTENDDQTSSVFLHCNGEGAGLHRRMVSEWLTFSSPRLIMTLFTLSFQ